MVPPTLAAVLRGWTLGTFVAGAFFLVVYFYCIFSLPFITLIPSSTSTSLPHPHSGCLFISRVMGEVGH